MKLTDEEWTRLREAVELDDENKFRALVSQVITRAVAADRSVVSRRYRLPHTRYRVPFFCLDR